MRRHPGRRVQVPRDLARLHARLGLMDQAQRTERHRLDHLADQVVHRPGQSRDVVVALQPDPVTARRQPVQPRPVVRRHPAD